MALTLLSCSSTRTRFPEGGEDDGGINSALGCLSVTPDPAASRAGAVSTATTFCNRTTLYASPTSTLVHVIGEQNGDVSGAITLSLGYLASRAAPVSVTEASASTTSGVVVTLDYTVHPAGGGPPVSWACESSRGESPPVGTFRVDVVSFQEGLAYGQGKTSDSVHGTMHAVCPQKSGNGADGGDASGSVTLDGPF